MRRNSILCITLWLIVNISGLNAATCSYSIKLDYGYSCELSSANMNNPDGTLAIYGVHVSGKDNSDVTSLKVQSSSSTIVSVPADIFNKFKNLFALGLMSVKIQTLNRNSFINCDQLAILNLESNMISLIPNQVFEKCNNLRWLNLKQNLITNIESDAFSGLPDLYRIDISYNKITQLDFNVVGFKQLKYFDFSNNEVFAVKTDFHSNLKNIEYIDGQLNVCINAKYEHFPVTESDKSMFEKCYQNYKDLSKDKTVSCKHYLNKDYGYTSEIANVNSLFDTDILNTSHLSGKTDKNVTLVFVKNSNFMSIPNEIFTKYPALTYLSMSNVGITTLNENSFKNTGNLKIIWLNKNKITELPAFVFKEAPKLEQLMLIGNQISEINVDAFSGSSRLLRLDLSNNKLETLPSGSLQSLTNLQILMLANNAIKDIHHDTFNGLINLRYLNLDGSYLVDVPEEWFKTTTKLQTLHLQNNQINTIGKNAFSTLGFLKELKLENNICVSINFENIKTVDVDVIPNITKCVN